MIFNGQCRRFTRLFGRHFKATPLAVSSLLFIFFLLQWLQHGNLVAKKKEVAETLTIYRQMQNYSQSVCNAKNKEEDLLIPGSIDKVDLEMVGRKVTFILIAQPDLICANSRIKELRERYPNVNVITAFENTDITPKKFNEASFPFLKQVVNLGGFMNYPDALQNAILSVKTDYFLVVDTQLSIPEVRPGFVEKLMSVFRGFDVLGGSQINAENKFFIPCHSLKLQNWTFFERFEYTSNRYMYKNLLECESTSSHFLAKTEAFKKVLDDLKGFDTSIGVMWRQDFFIRSKGFLVVGTLPEVVFKNTPTALCPRVEIIEKKKRIDGLLPFVDKYHILDFVNQDGNKTSICDGTDPLICSEKYIFPKWKLKHWAYSGLTAFPFIIERLRDALYFGTAQLEKAGMKYVVEGGTLLGFIKVQAILPWDSGDVDTFVYSNRRPIINLVKKIKQEVGYEYKLRWNAFHVYVTPYYPTHDGLIVYALNRNVPEGIINIRLHGKLFPAPRTMFKFIREYYGASYLESRIRFGDERVSCDYEGYQACMPDCRWDGCGSGRGQFPGIL